jgi:WD repeat-containing protein 23
LLNSPGTNDAYVYLFDFETKRNIARFKGHSDDVNAVSYLDPMDPNILVSGSDDALIMVWDRRMGGNAATRKPQGLLLGGLGGMCRCGCSWAAGGWVVCVEG